jgi:hypothetical protein
MSKAICAACGEEIDMDAEGVEYPDGRCWHDGCHDSEEEAEQNAGDEDPISE